MHVNCCLGLLSFTGGNKSIVPRIRSIEVQGISKLTVSKSHFFGRFLTLRQQYGSICKKMHCNWSTSSGFVVAKPRWKTACQKKKGFSSKNNQTYMAWQQKVPCEWSIVGIACWYNIAKVISALHEKLSVPLHFGIRNFHLSHSND